MDRDILKKQGFSLFELSIGIAIVIVLVSAVMLVSSQLTKQSKALKTLKEMETISLACQQYYQKNVSWPAQLSDLQPQFIPKTFGSSNPFGQEYILQTSNEQITIITLIPQGIIKQSFIGPQVVISSQGEWDQVNLSRSKKVGISGRVQYDTKYRYNDS